MSDKSNQKEKDNISKILSEDFVTPSGNPLAQTQQHINNDKFHEKVMGNQSNINEMALETKLKRRYSGIQKKNTFTLKDLKKIGMDELLNKTIVVPAKDEEFLRLRKIPKISQQEYENLKNSIIDIKNLTNLYDYLSKLNCNFKSVACFDSVGGMSPLTYLIESNYHANVEMEEEMYKKYNELKTYIYNYRTINGDGNCFYRAVMFRYLEILVLTKNIEHLQNVIADFVKCFNSEELKSRLIIRGMNIKPDLSSKILILIVDLLKNKMYDDAHKILVKSFSTCKKFDYAMILYFRYILYDYIKNNENKVYLNTFPIKIGNLLPSQYETEDGKFLFNSFYENYLLNFFTDAEKIIIYLTPFVLEVELNIIIFDDNQEEVLQKFKWEGDSELNINEVISLLNFKNHYEIIYTPENHMKYEKLFENYENEQKSIILKKYLNQDPLAESGFNLLTDSIKEEINESNNKKAKTTIFKKNKAKDNNKLNKINNNISRNQNNNINNKNNKNYPNQNNQNNGNNENNNFNNNMGNNNRIQINYNNNNNKKNNGNIINNNNINNNINPQYKNNNNINQNNIYNDNNLNNNNNSNNYNQPNHNYNNNQNSNNFQNNNNNIVNQNNQYSQYNQNLNHNNNNFNKNYNNKQNSRNNNQNQNYNNNYNKNLNYNNNNNQNYNNNNNQNYNNNNNQNYNNNNNQNYNNNNNQNYNNNQKYNNNNNQNYNNNNNTQNYNNNNNQNYNNNNNQINNNSNYNNDYGQNYNNNQNQYYNNNQSQNNYNNQNNNNNQNFNNNQNYNNNNSNYNNNNNQKYNNNQNQNYNNNINNQNYNNIQNQNYHNNQKYNNNQNRNYNNNNNNQNYNNNQNQNYHNNQNYNNNQNQNYNNNQNQNYNSNHNQKYNNNNNQNYSNINNNNNYKNNEYNNSNNPYPNSARNNYAKTPLNAKDLNIKTDIVFNNDKKNTIQQKQINNRDISERHYNININEVYDNMPNNNNSNEKNNKNNSNQNKRNNENYNNMEIRGLKTPGQDSNPPSNISLNSNKNGNKKINTNNNSPTPMGLITPNGDKNDNKNKNQIRCIKCKNPINNQKIQLCKFCFKKEIVDSYYSYYYNDVYNNMPHKIKEEFRIKIINKTYNLEEALMEYNEIFKNDYLDSKIIINELKKRICISCKNNIQDESFELPCKCHFCCKEELDKYIFNMDLSKEVLCLCGEKYTREMKTQLGILTAQLDLKSQKKLKEFFNYNLENKCCACGKTINNQIYPYTDLVSSIEQKNNSADKFLNKLLHLLCAKCFNENKNKGFNCLICKFIHFIPNQYNK